MVDVVFISYVVFKVHVVVYGCKYILNRYMLGDKLVDPFLQCSLNIRLAVVFRKDLL